MTIRTEPKQRKQIGSRNGLKIYSRLKTNAKIKPITEKQKKINATWKEVTDQRAKDVNFICEWCGKPGKRDAGFNCLTGHHILKRRYNDHNYSNCFCCHLLCHQEIENNAIDVRVIHNLHEWQNSKNTGGQSGG